MCKLVHLTIKSILPSIALLATLYGCASNGLSQRIPAVRDLLEQMRRGEFSAEREREYRRLLPTDSIYLQKFYLPIAENFALTEDARAFGKFYPSVGYFVDDPLVMNNYRATVSRDFETYIPLDDRFYASLLQELEAQEALNAGNLAEFHEKYRLALSSQTGRTITTMNYLRALLYLEDYSRVKEIYLNPENEFLLSDGDHYRSYLMVVANWTLGNTSQALEDVDLWTLATAYERFVILWSAMLRDLGLYADALETLEAIRLPFLMDQKNFSYEDWKERARLEKLAYIFEAIAAHSHLGNEAELEIYATEFSASDYSYADIDRMKRVLLFPARIWRDSIEYLEKKGLISPEI